jgi:hypothetical protein
VAGAIHQSAPERAIRAAHVLDLMISDPTITPEQVEEIRALPGVRGMSQLTGLGLVLRGDQYIVMTANVDGRWGRDVDVARIVRGRDADPDSAHEVVLGETVAKSLHVDVGDVLRFDSWSPEQLAAWAQRNPPRRSRPTFLGPTVDVEVVGISRHPADLTSDDPLSFFSALPPGFLRAYGGQVGEWFPLLAIDVGDAPSPARVAEVGAAALKIAGDDAAREDAGEQAGGPLVDTLGFVATAMLALAVAVGIAGAVLAGLLVARTVSTAAEDLVSLTPLGMTQRERARAIIAALAPTVVGAAMLAVALAVASSAFLPFGLAHRADPDPGLRVDVGMLPAGIAATAIILLAIIVISAGRAARRAPSTRPAAHPGVVARLARSGLPVGALCGLDRGGGVRRQCEPRRSRRWRGDGRGVGARARDQRRPCRRSPPRTAGSGTSRCRATPPQVWPTARGPAARSLLDTCHRRRTGDLLTGSQLAEGDPVLVVDGRPPGPGDRARRRTRGLKPASATPSGRAENVGCVVGEAVFAGVVGARGRLGAAVPMADLGRSASAGTPRRRPAWRSRMAWTAAFRELAARRARRRPCMRRSRRSGCVRSSHSVAADELPDFAGFVVIAAIVVTIRRRGGDLAVLNPGTRAQMAYRGHLHTARQSSRSWHGRRHPLGIIASQAMADS